MTQTPIPDHFWSQSIPILNNFLRVVLTLMRFNIKVTFLTPCVVWSLGIPSPPPPSCLETYATILSRFGLKPMPARNLLVALAWTESRVLLGTWEDARGDWIAGRQTLEYANLVVALDWPYEQVSCDILSAFFLRFSACALESISGFLRHPRVLWLSEGILLWINLRSCV
jgi:hypothetical protein